MNEWGVMLLFHVLFVHSFQRACREWWQHHLVQTFENVEEQAQLEVQFGMTDALVAAVVLVLQTRHVTHAHVCVHCL